MHALAAASQIKTLSAEAAAATSEMTRAELTSRRSAAATLAEQLEIAFENDELSQGDYYAAMKAGYQRDMLGCVRGAACCFACCRRVWVSVCACVRACICVRVHSCSTGSCCSARVGKRCVGCAAMLCCRRSLKQLRAAGNADAALVSAVVRRIKAMKTEIGEHEQMAAANAAGAGAPH